MSRIIVLSYEDKLRDLFFGTWREEYQKFSSLEEISATTIRSRMREAVQEQRFPRFKLKARRGSKRTDE